MHKNSHMCLVLNLILQKFQKWLSIGNDISPEPHSPSGGWGGGGVLEI